MIGQAKLWVMVLLATVLAGCVTQPAVPYSTQSLSQRQQYLARLNYFTVEGGLGVWTEQESISARIQWQQQADNYDVRVDAPMGLASMRLWKEDGIVFLQRGDAAKQQAQSAGLLLQQALNLAVNIPVDQLPLWMRGLPGAASDVIFDERQQLQSLHYHDEYNRRWKVVFRRYTQVDNITVPTLVTAEGGEYSIRLVLKNWRFGESIGRVEQIVHSTRLQVPLGELF